MAMEEPLSPTLEIWIDGDCAVCRRSEQWCSARDPHRRLNFVDFRAPSDDDPPGSRETMAQVVHVRLRDGTVRTGFEAWRQILFELDGWRWLARVSGLPGIKHLGPVIYSILAKNRHRLSLSKA